MTLTDALILGLIQGITEFLPISSSGHLVIGTAILGIEEPSLIFDIILHIGSLVSILIYFHRRILKINTTQINYLAIGTIPIVLLSLTLRPLLDQMFTSLWLVGMGLIITAFFLFLTSFNFARNKRTTSSLKTAIIIGIFQAIAVIPGISRSGSTVSAGLILGLSRKEAFEFSFFLAIPAIIGALVLHLPELSNINTIDYNLFVLGFGISVITGIISLGILERVIKQAKLHWFGVYCLALGVLTLGWQYLG